MTPRSFLVPLLGFAILNGIFSPLIGLSFLFAPLVLPPFVGEILPLRFMSASLILATATVIAGGIPAAIYERATRQAETGNVSMWIWLAGVALLSAPAVANAIRIGL